ncbi:transporter substrate-binding domain-containing protein [Salinimonas lutimaris]|uniref:transporter substrate-binding domain-containing protein n=1 Tax=Salinimonas lutimaris TaxID=914153 RepID=UPI0010BFF94B|nr:transporter substrate-binding domain-containing protein [Salinimonas lutimaris]
MNRMLTFILALAGALFSAFALAQIDHEKTLVVGIKEAPPFVIKSDQGEYSGISIHLFEQIAAELNLNYRYQETDLPGLLQGLESGRFDASVAALTVNAAREQRVDFSHPFYTTGLAIATSKEESRLMRAISGFFSWGFAAALGGLCMLLLGVGLVIWLAERRGNPEQFGGSRAQGIGAGFWWAAVTMTTVGYGDKAPITKAGRAIGFIWMFAAIILISSFTAAIATSLTVSQLETRVQGMQDLPQVKVITLANSAASQFLRDQNIAFTTVATVRQGLQRINEGNADAMVYDKPILAYQLRLSDFSTVQILPDVIDRQDYAIALPDNSPLRESVNTRLLTIIDRQAWQDELDNLLGDSR